MTFLISKNQNSRAGFTILYATIVSGIVLAIGLSVLNITLKQFLLSSVARESEVAFHAAYAGIECLRFYDRSTTDGHSFDIGSPSANINCFGGTDTSPDTPASGQAQDVAYTWTADGTAVCTEAEIYKFHDTTADAPIAQSQGGPIPDNEVVLDECPQNAYCTVIQSRGYNAACNSKSGPRVVEREITIEY
jgi:hypothetical protein